LEMALKDVFVEEKTKKLNLESKGFSFSTKENSEERFINPISQNNHIINDNPIKLSCYLCKYTCTKVEILINHMLRMHPLFDLYFKCPLCKYESSEVNIFKKHLSVHSGDNLFHCSVCDYISTDPGYFELHM
ncbi:unnamed protein product, partial [Meganyctiphanes norvegica]